MIRTQPKHWHDFAFVSIKFTAKKDAPGQFRFGGVQKKVTNYIFLPTIFI